MALVLAPSIEGPPSIDGLIAGAVIHIAAAGVEAVGVLGQITQQAAKQAGSALGDLTDQAWGAINNAFVQQSPGYVFPDGTFNENGFVAAPLGAGNFSYSWKLVGDPTIYGESLPGVRIITVQRIPLLLNQWLPYYWGEGIIVHGYNLNGTIISSVGLRQGGGGGQLVFDAGPEPQVKLEYLKFIWVPETGAEIEVQAQPFVGNPPRTKVPLKRKAAVLPQTKAAVTPLPLPNPSRVVPPITEDQPNDTPQPSPEFQPQTEPTPAKPTVVPSVFPSPVRTTPTQPDGTPLPVTAAKPTPTPKDAHVVNNQIIPANGPQPSLDGIAKEVGRIESKMASVMKSAPLKDPLEWDEIIAILRLLKDLFDGITDDEPQSAYQISSPCELDDQEQRIVFASTIAASTDKFGAIINRINAVADLLQHSKNLKQPLCPGQRFPVSGQAVTVNFTQID